jgi:hypothetical protein
VGRRRTRQLTSAQFNAAMIIVVRMSPQRRAAARRALVDGETAQAIASFYGWRRSAVHAAERTVWFAYQRFLAARLAEDADGHVQRRRTAKARTTSP